MSVGSAGTGADCKKTSQAIFPPADSGRVSRSDAAPRRRPRDGTGRLRSLRAGEPYTRLTKNVVFLQQSSNTDFRGPPDSPRHARSEPHCYAGVDSDTLSAPSQSQNPGRTQT